MSPDLRGIAARATESALRGIAGDLPEILERADALLTPLARVGDALRLGIDIPRSLRRWLSDRTRDELNRALVSLIEETVSWKLPTVAVDDRDDPLFASVLRRRDEAESIRAAIRRTVQPKGEIAEDGDAYKALSTVLTTIDEAIGRVATRSRVTELLGARAAIPRTWTDQMDDAVVEEATATETHVPPEALASFHPSDEDVARYVARGALPRLVEGVASVNDLFAEELTDCIDGLLEAREEVGLVARRWRKAARAAPTRDPLVLPFIPRARLAAATVHVGPSVATKVHLGELAPLDAEARVALTSRDVVLEVFPGNAPLTRVELGGAFSAAADADGTWRVQLSLPLGPVRLRVVAADGREFASDIGFAATEPSDETE